MRSHARLALAALLVSAGLASAQVVITTDTTIAPGDPTYQNQDVIVRGCVVTIDGAQAFNSLTIERNKAGTAGVVTHTAAFSSGGVNGMFLTIAGGLSIQGSSGDLPPSRIDVNAKGFPTGQGPGSRPTPVPDSGAGVPFPQGGSYGGAGGRGSPNGPFYNLPEFEPGPCYGSYIEPTDLGSGSAFTLQGPPPGIRFGSPGAGAVHLIVGSTATIDGVISANGGGSGGSGFDAGGAGGSIWISAATIAGSGAITAHGGAGSTAGGGGGGRIAIHANALPFTGPILAAGSGTVFYRVTGQNDTIVIDNTIDLPGVAGAAEFSGNVTIDADVILRNGAGLSARRGDTAPLNLTVNGAISIDATSFLGAPGCGPMPAPDGNGSFGNTFINVSGGGGGHGGAGAPGLNGPSGPVGIPGVAYGDPNNPVTFGGAGGAFDLGTGVRGGGALRLVTTSPITLNGVITANGSPQFGFGGSGAGGSVWIEAPAISGSGFVTANGGGSAASAGGGGRIRIDSCSIGLPAGNIVASGANPGSIVTNGATTDWNNDGTVNSTDVSDFINDWFTDQAKGSTITDFNGDGVSNSTDVSDFINAWFAEEAAC